MSTTVRDKELCRLLEEAMQLPTDQQSPFLHRSAGDTQLAREVEALLHEQSMLSGFLAEPAAGILDNPLLDNPLKPGSTQVPRWDPQPSDRLGPFRILELLGRGGMGAVYSAEQTEPVARRVAVKIVRPSLVDDQTLRRFEAERQALARLTHPNVARLYEAGSTESGEPYFAMEMVEGAPITHFCNRARLGLRNRIALFRTVCDGVAHAHQKGILHRDLKPSNILVTQTDGRPSAKIIDFGIAKALDRPLVEATLATGAHMIGTPAYMSPETADSHERVDTRSDVYSLGVVLYELLVGVLPLGEPGDSPLRLLRRIGEEQPSRPAGKWRALSAQERNTLAEQRRASSEDIARRLEGDLESVVMKALAGEPEQRYGSVRELNDDLGRFLRDEPVEARKPSLLEQISRFVRRRRAAVIAAALIVLSLIAGIIGTSVGLLRAREEAESARRALVEAEEVSSLMISLFEGSDVTRAKGKEPSFRDFLEQGALKAATSLADQPMALARFQTAIGSSYIGLADYDRAEKHLKEALDLYAVDREANLAKWAEGAINLTTITMERDLEEARRLTNEVEESLHSGLPGFSRLRAILSINQAQIAIKLGDYAEARDKYAITLAYYETAGDAHQRRLAQALSGLATAELWLGNNVESERLIRRSTALFEEIYGPSNHHVAVALHNLGTALSNQNKNDEAIQALERSLRIQEEVLGQDGPYLTATLNGLGGLYKKTGRLEDAENALNRAVTLLLDQAGPEHPTLAYLYLNLGEVARDRGELDRAGELIEDAHRIRLEALGADHPLVGESLVSLGQLRGLQGRPQDGVGLLLDALAIFERALEQDHPNVISALTRLGALQTQLGHYDDAERRLLRALGLGRDPEAVGNVEEHLATLRLSRNHQGTETQGPP